MKNRILRQTKSVCPICVEEIDADIVEDKNRIFMMKECKIHGKFKIFISNDSKCYKELIEIFLKIPKNRNNETFYFFPTAKCNQNCDICYIDTHNLRYKDMSIDEIKEKIKFKNKKISLIGGEPTTRKDFPEIIKALKASGNYVSVFTNGKNISDIKYLKTLKNGGVDEICLQFDGFDDRFYDKFRGEILLRYKCKALENLKNLDIPTLLESVIIKKENEGQMGNIIDFCIRNDFINGVGFNSYRNFGKGNLGHDKSITNNEIIGILEKATKKRIAKKDILVFQKVLYMIYYLGILKPRGCFNHYYYLLVRNRKGYKTINEYINLERFEKKSKYLKRKRYSKVRIWFLLLSLLKFKTFVLLPSVIKVLFGRNTRLPKDMLFLQFVSPCDKYTFDSEISKYCPNNEVIDGKISSSGFNNIKREKEFIRSR